MKLTKKLFVAIMTMALLVVTFGTSTFAWFTLSQTSEISNFKASVKTDEGMEVSLDGKAWTNNLILADSNVIFEDLTSGDGIAITFRNGADAAANTDYILVPLYIRVTSHTAGTSDYAKIFLDSISGKDKDFTLDADKWIADATLEGTYNNHTIVANNLYNFDALNALKVSFTANGDTAPKFIYGYENDNSFGTASKTGLVKKYAKEKGFLDELYNDIPAALPSYVTYTASSATAQNGFVKYDTAASEKENVLVADDFGNFASLNLSGVTNVDDVNYVYAKVTVRIWLEGWDADCINAILAQGTELKFVLTASKNA